MIGALTRQDFAFQVTKRHYGIGGDQEKLSFLDEPKVPSYHQMKTRQRKRAMNTLKIRLQQEQYRPTFQGIVNIAHRNRYTTCNIMCVKQKSLLDIVLKLPFMQEKSFLWMDTMQTFDTTMPSLAYPLYRQPSVQN